MRILHVIDTLNPAAGGPATVVGRVAAAQARLGHMVTVLSYLDPAEKDIVDKNLATIPGVDKVHWDFMPSRSGLDWVFVLSARDHLRQAVESATVVHLHGVWEPLLRAAARMARDRNIPYVVRPAGMLDPWSLRQHWFKKFLAMRAGYRRMFNRCAYMHTLNADEKRLIARLRLRCALEVIPNGVFLEEVSPRPAKGSFRATHPELGAAPYVLFLSRLHRKKGLDHLADAFVLLAQLRPDVHLVVAGPDGGARADFLARISRAGLQHRVHLVGPIYGPEKFAAIVDASVFCLPSRQEGFSLAITEALASGLPAVISPECHFPEVEQVGAGHVVDLDARKIADALADVLSDDAKRQRMSVAGAALVHIRYTWPRIAEQTVDAYNRAFARRGSPFRVRDVKRMKIVHVISSLAVEAGGPPVVCAGLAGAQAAMGHDVTVAAVEIPGQKKVAMPPGVTVVEFPITGVERYASSPELDAWLKRNGPGADFFHLHSVWQFPTWAAANVCRANNKPYVVLLNGMLETYSVKHRNHALKKLYWKIREHKVVGGAAGLHCLNIAEVKKAIPWISHMPKFVCGNGIRADQFQNMPDRGRFRAAFDRVGNRPMILFMSRIHPKKGLDRLLPAWHAVVEKYPDSVLVIAGTGDEHYVAKIDALIASHNLAKHVLRVGQITGPLKWEALVDADLFVLPSHQEGFSMAITESLAAACPAVATEDCNFSQLTTHDCGIEIPGGDMNAFTAAVNGLMADPARRQRLGENGRRLVRERFTWEGIVSDLQQVYEWIIAGKPLPADGADVWRPIAPAPEWQPQEAGAASAV